LSSLTQAQLTIVQGPLFDEVHQELNSWISQVINSLQLVNALKQFNYITEAITV